MNKKTILIVEDDIDLSDTYRDYFEFRGFEIVGQIYDEIEAIELIKKLKPNLVILDTVISWSERHSAIKELQKMSPSSKIFIITSSDYNLPDDTKVDVFRKPFSLSKFTKALSSLNLL
jgi:response regulator of citrate/malate metabolism